MKICYIASDVVVPHTRGASTHTLELSRHLGYRGHEVNLICRRGDGQLVYEEIDGVRVHRIRDGIIFSNPLSSYQGGSRSGGRNDRNHFLRRIYGAYFTKVLPVYAGMQAVRIIKSSNSNVILERETSFGAGGIASYITGRPLFVEIIGPRYSHLSTKRASGILYYNPAMLDDSVADEKRWWVSAAANIELFKFNKELRTRIRTSLGLSDKIVSGYLGTFTEWQGVGDIIEVVSKLSEKNDDFHFLMIGPYYHEAERHVRQLGLQDHFTFVGEVPYEDVPGYLSASDILLAPYNPSRSSRKQSGIGSSLKIFEYMACERPVITSKVYPITKEIIDGRDALIIPPGDKSALALALERLARDPAQKRRLGRAGRILVEKKYSWAGFAKTLEERIYQALGNAVVSS